MMGTESNMAVGMVYNFSSTLFDQIIYRLPKGLFDKILFFTFLHLILHEGLDFYVHKYNGRLI